MLHESSECRKTISYSLFLNRVAQADMRRRSDSLKENQRWATAKPFAELVFAEKGGSGEKRRARFYRGDCVCPSRALSTLSTRSTIRRHFRRIVVFLFAFECFTFCIFFAACAGSLYRNGICLTFIIFVMNTSFDFTFYMRYGIGITVIHCVGSAWLDFFKRTAASFIAFTGIVPSYFNFRTAAAAFPVAGTVNYSAI